MNRVGIFAGTFDPVHNGHIAFALEAVKVCGLDKLYFLPTRKPQRKSGVTSFDHRLKMLELAAGQHNQLEVMTLPDNQFTVPTTLPRLEKKIPHAKITFLFGSDIVGHMSSWPEVDKLVSAHRLAIGLRTSDDKKDLQKTLKDLDAKSSFISAPYSGVAGSLIRGKDKNKLIPAVIKPYIKANKLYQ